MSRGASDRSTCLALCSLSLRSPLLIIQNSLFDIRYSKKTCLRTRSQKIHPRAVRRPHAQAARQEPRPPTDVVGLCRGPSPWPSPKGRGESVVALEHHFITHHGPRGPALVGVQAGDSARAWRPVLRRVRTTIVEENCDPRKHVHRCALGVPPERRMRNWLGRSLALPRT